MQAVKTLFITGVSSGFGQALAQLALAEGHRVIGTVRSDSARAAFEALSPRRAVAVELDVTDFAAIDAVVDAVEAQHGPVDVLVNNAGYGHEGVFEESSLAEMRQQFEVNVFGAVAVTKAFLPYFRRRRAGHILNITSMGGHITMPGIAYYCGSLRGDIGHPEQGADTLQYLRHGRGAGVVSYRLGGPLDAAHATQHQRLRCQFQSAAPGPRGKERPAAGGSIQGGPRHADPDRQPQPACSPAAGQRCPGAGT